MIAALLLAAAAPTFDPIRFFAGETRGEGGLKVLLRRRVPVFVRGAGRIEPDGALVLDQVIVEGNKPARSRRWRLRQVAPGRYQGVLTDARGPVSAAADGPVLRLSYVTPAGFRVRQTLRLAPDGRSATNRLEARRLGLTVATLTERIVKAD